MAANNEIGDALRFLNGLPPEATIDDKDAFAKQCLSSYIYENSYGSSLSEFYAEDFALFSVEDFSSNDSGTRRNLRDLLRKRGVYEPKGRNIRIAESLHQVARDELVWPDDDPDKPIKTEDKNLNVPSVVEVQTEERRKASAEDRFEDQARQALQDNDIHKPDIVTTKDISTYTNFKHINMGNLLNAYGNDQDKYRGPTTDNFERKFLLFQESCDQSGIREEDRHRAFSIMLISHTRQFYFDSLKRRNLDLRELVDEIKQRFLTPERARALLREWESLSLQTIVSRNPDNLPSVNLEALIEKLTDIQSPLPQGYQSELILRNKLLNAVRDVPACQLDYHKTADTIQGVISDLHASLSMPIENNNQSAQASTPVAHFVDRRLISGKGVDKKESTKPKKCFVCGRSNCWSSNHSPKERIQSYRKKKAVQNVLASLDDSDSGEDPDEQTSEAIEDIMAHFIQINPSNGDNTLDEDGSDKAGDCFSHIATIIESDNPISFAARLQDAAFAHAVLAVVPTKRFGKNFEGILVNTGAAHGSSAGLTQYKAYCSLVGKHPSIADTRAATCHFGIGSTKSLGVAPISFPIGHIWLSFDVHVVNADTLILLSIDDMDKLGIYLNNLDDTLVHQASALKAPIVRTRGHPFVTWNPHISCFLTTTELGRRHRRFGHPSMDKLMNLLGRSEIDNFGPDTRKLLQNIEKHCNACQTYAQKPRRVKLTLRYEKQFNHTVYADIFYIDSKPILHVVDEATNFQSARWLSDMTSRTLWKALLMCWIDVYLGPRDFIVHDAGKTFMGAAFQASTDMLHIRTKSVPVECENSMTIVERYHAPIRRAYNIIIKEVPNMEKDEALQMAVEAINDSVGPRGLVPTLLVFGALPRLGLPTSAPAASTFKRATAVKKAALAM